MTQNEIIEMARQAGLIFNERDGAEKARQIHFERVELFAKLVAAKEREACAKVCDDRAFRFFSESPFFVEMHGLADVIRARGEA